MGSTGPTPRFVIFDLDETLYPSSNGMVRAFRERIVEFIASRIGVSRDAADELRETYFREYGLSLTGLCKDHDVDIRDYMSFIHDIPHSEYIDPDPGLEGMLSRISLAKVIFTNSDRSHVARTLAALGVSPSHFECVFDYEAAGCHPKPEPEAYRRLLEHIGAVGRECVIIEDSPRNLVTAKDVFGMRTVLIDRDGSRMAGLRAAAGFPARGGRYIDWVISDLLQLEQILAS